MSRIPIDINAKFKPNSGVSPLLKMLAFSMAWAIIGGALAYGALAILEKWVNL